MQRKLMDKGKKQIYKTKKRTLTIKNTYSNRKNTQQQHNGKTNKRNTKITQQKTDKEERHI